MKRFLLLLFLFAVQLGAVTLTTITGTLRDAQGNLESGTLVISWPSFVSPDPSATTITSCTNASPIVCLDTAHGYSTNDTVFISGVTTGTAANGDWRITRVDADHFSLNGSTGNGAGSGGTALRYTTIGAGSLNYTLTAGAINLTLVPTANATLSPGGATANLTYRVGYYLAGGSQPGEYWSVPTTSPVDVQAIRTSINAGPTSTFDPGQIKQSGATDTQVLCWSASQGKWVPCNQTGLVTSVFGQTGAVPNLSGDVQTSGSSVVTVTRVNGGAFPASAHIVVTDGSSKPSAGGVDDVSAVQFCQAAGASGTAYTCSLSPAPSGYTTGTLYRFKADVANSGADPTVNFNSLGAKTIKKVQGGVATALVASDIQAGQWVTLVYDGTNMQMASQLGNTSGGAVTSVFTQTGAVPNLSGDATTSGSSAVTVVKVNGTSVPTNSAADQVLGTTASATAAWATLPNCGDSSHAIAYNTSTHAFSCQSITGSAGTPSFPVNPQTTTYQVLAADFSSCKAITVASGTFTVTLVASGSQPSNGECVWVINYGSGVVTVARSGQNINGGTASLTLAAASATAPTGAFVVSDGTDYFAQTFGGGGGGPALTAPSSADWNHAFNTGSMVQTPTYVNSRWEFATIASGGDSLEGIAHTLPSVPYSETFRIWPMVGRAQYSTLGVGIADGTLGSPGKIKSCGVVWAAGGTGVQGTGLGVTNWNSTTSFNANLALTGGWSAYDSIPSGPIWIRLADDNTNYTCSVSFDGTNFSTFFTEARNAFLTPTQFVVFGDSASSNQSAKMIFDSYGP